MYSIKKTWYTDMKLICLMCVGISLFLTACVTFAMHQESILIIVTELFKFWLNITLIFGMSYPIKILKQISPNRGSVFDAPNITSFLPYSKKQLLWIGIKSWVIAFPVYVFINLCLLAFIKNQVLLNYETVQYIIGGGIYSIGTMAFMVIIVLQVMGGMMITLAKSYHGIKVVLIISVINGFMFFVLGTMVIELFRIDTAVDMTWMLVYYVLFIALAIVIFLIGFKQIEEIYQ